MFFSPQAYQALFLACKVDEQAATLMRVLNFMKPACMQRWPLHMRICKIAQLDSCHHARQDRQLATTLAFCYGFKAVIYLTVSTVEP